MDRKPRNPLYVNYQDGPVCFHEHGRQRLPVNQSVVFCDCPVVDDPHFTNLKDVVCVRDASVDEGQHDEDVAGPE